MNRNICPDKLIAGLEQTFARDSMPSRNEMRALLRLCADPDAELRERALLCLLHPLTPAGEEIHLRRLLHFIAAAGFETAILPRPLLQLAFEIVAELRGLPGDARMASRLCGLFRSLARDRAARPFDRRFAVAPFLRMLEGRLQAPGRESRAVSLRRRLRLLRLRLRTFTSSPGWAELTLKDLESLLPKGRDRKGGYARGRWAARGRPLFHPPAAPRSLPLRLPPMVSVHWGGASGSRLRSMENLVRLQAEELIRVRELARSVSRKTGRVVLSWHNATLAAAGGWAFDDPGRAFCSQALREEFHRAVSRRASELDSNRNLRLGAADLGALREDRIFRPKLIHALVESRFRHALESAGEQAWREEAERWSVLLEARAPEWLAASGKYAWTGAMSPHQRIGAGEIAGWIDKHRESWAQGLFLLAALNGAAQEFMSRGRLEAFVLPWIDKFFISTRREGDLEYLPRLIRWLEKTGPPPLVLLWEDTSHARAPSLQLALEQLRAAGHAVRGIGVFDRAGSNRAAALPIILAEHERTRVFVLRPFDDNHRPVSLERILDTDGPAFFRDYDSSWKDNLGFLYAGTQVFPLLSIQGEMEDFAPWLAFDRIRVPFGAYLRGRLRCAISAGEGDAGDSFAERHAVWANLL